MMQQTHGYQNQKSYFQTQLAIAIGFVEFVFLVIVCEMLRIRIFLMLDNYLLFLFRYQYGNELQYRLGFGMQRNNLNVVGPLPDGLLLAYVVVVVLIGLGVNELPPLVRIVGFVTVENIGRCHMKKS
jgi:hypothetical protein